MMIEESDSEYLMWMKRKQILKSHLAGVGDGSISSSNNNNYYSSWEERAFAEDAARVLGGSIWPPRSYSCSFCKREFRSAQALGGHMNVHRRDRARLKQNLSPHHHQTLLELDHHHHHHKIDCNSLGNHQLSSQSSQLDCCLNPHSSPANTTITTTTRLSSSAMSTGENCGQSTKISSIMLHEGVVNARDLDDEDKFKGFLGCSNNYVETSLSVGLSSSMFGQKSPNILPCGDRTIMSCKRVKTNISSMPVMKFLKPCSNGRGLAFQQSAEVILGGVNNHPGIIEDLDLELRLGKQQKVK